MKKNNANFLIFSIGALGYGLIEILWRGHTHWSMLTAGGICFTFFASIGEKFKKAGIIFKSIVGCVFITTVELILGIIFNVILKKNVWDYSKMPLNIAGQICALYSFFWFVLSIIFIPFASNISKKLRKKH